IVDTESRVRLRRRLHPAWSVAAVAFVALIGAAGFRAAPGVLMVPLQEEFGTSRGVLSVAVGINLVLFGLTAPFAAALIDRFGIRRVTAIALVLVSAGSATGQLIFLPLIAWAADRAGWRAASLIIAAAALAVVPLVLLFLRDRPADLHVTPYGAPEGYNPPPPAAGSAARRAIGALRQASRSRTFWALVAGFAICGATTNGLIGTHFVPAAHDHGLPETTAAGLLAVVGIFDIVGTIVSGALTDRVNPRILLAIYYALRGVGLLMLPGLLSDAVHVSIIAFVVVYGLDWVATVPPTVALCREAFGEQGTVVFGWVFAAHQLGAALMSVVAGVLRDALGDYTLAWFSAAALCAVAAGISLGIRRLPANWPAGSSNDHPAGPAIGS